MRFLQQLLGLALLLWGLYLLGNNIIFGTGPHPYWWRGIAADLSVGSLTAGILGLFTLPRSLHSYAWGLIFFGVIFVVASGYAYLRPTSLWQFFLWTAMMVGGWKLLTEA